MSRPPVIFVGAVGELDPLPVAAALALATGRARDLPPVLLDLEGGRTWKDGLLAAEAARARAAAVGADLNDQDRASLAGAGPAWRVAARGRLVMAAAAGDGLRPADPCSILTRIEGEGPVVVGTDPGVLQAAVAARPAGSSAVVAVARRGRDRALCGLLAIELRAIGVPFKLWTARVGGIQSRRALAGLDPASEAAERADRVVRALREERGQVLPALLGLIVVAVLFTLALAGLGGAAGSKGRAQRAVDLAALSAARAMRDDFDRLFIPAQRADGSPDPRHLSRVEYLRGARGAAAEAARRNGLPEGSVRVEFPDGESFAPLRVAVEARPTIEIDGRPPEAEEVRVRVDAEAAVEPAAESGAAPAAMASGGGYAGPLAYRQGKPMRPDAAAAFDRLSASAAGAGHHLLVNSAFRSDAEQARLFAANPDPRWVARPGTSLHRCGTELDLGPPAAYGWLAANAGRFGFERRYSWEPWHFGLVDGPEPCSAAGDRLSSVAGAAGSDGRGSAGLGLPEFVPAWVRAPLLRAAARHGVSAALLAAQLMAESNFNPAAVSPAGAQGIAQFMPATAAAYGLSDPFDPGASIDAQARLMADLLEQFASPRLALAAYNAGPAPVAACNCIPPYPETQAYVARILALIGGSAGLTSPEPTLEVRLIS